MPIARRSILAVVGAALLSMLPRAEASAQDFTLSPSSSNAGTVGWNATTPTFPGVAQYSSGLSAPTPSWTLIVGSCPTNKVKNGETCVVRAKLSQSGLAALGSIRAQMTVSGGSACVTANGARTVTLTSTTTAVDFLEAARGSSTCQATFTFLVTDMSYTKYVSGPSASTYYSQGVAFDLIVR